MVILEPINTAQSVTVYLRNSAIVYELVLQDEETSVKYTYPITGVYEGGQLTFEISHDFIEARFYMLYINDENNKNLNKTKVFVTEQTDLEKYSITSDYYKTIEKDERTYIVKERE